MKRTALVIGATGGAGSETALALLRRGWEVRAVHRRKAEAEKHSPDPRITWVEGDALDAASVVRAAVGASVIVHAVNPPGYRNWEGLVLPMLDSTIAAARSSGARIVLPGTVYNYGPGLRRVDESTPQEPRSRKGKIRVAMEQRLRTSGLPVLVVRAGDFFGASAKSSWFSQGLVKPGRPVQHILYPAKADVGHSWAYLPDLAETIALLLDRASELPTFAVFHFRGHWFPRGIAIAEGVRRVAGALGARIWPFPWLLAYLLAPFHETLREMIEMRYLWREPLELANDRLVAFLGEEPHTPIDQALRETLQGLGCLDRPTSSLSSSSLA